MVILYFIKNTMHPKNGRLWCLDFSRMRALPLLEIYADLKFHNSKSLQCTVATIYKHKQRINLMVSECNLLYYLLVLLYFQLSV